MQNSIEKYLQDNWGKKKLVEIQSNLNINLYDLLNLAFHLGLHRNITTPSERRHWTEEEDVFLRDNERKVSITEASNLLYRSRYATYQRVRLLNLKHMIKNRDNK